VRTASRPYQKTVTADKLDAGTKNNILHGESWLTEHLEMAQRLAAIVAADVEGYSRHVSRDERAAVDMLSQRREKFQESATKYRGRVVDTAGDSILAEFGSVVDAVSCSIEAQREIARLNASLDPTQRMRLRIGVHTGDVLVKEGREIFGDGVNIAARLQELAEPGGVCISGTALEQVQGKLSARPIDLGRKTVKNIANPIRVFALRADAIENLRIGPRGSLPTVLGPWRKKAVVVGVAIVVGVVALIGTIRFRHLETTRSSARLTSTKPAARLSLVVLPFANLSGEASQDYVADGITEDLTTDVARIAGTFVISRNTAFAFKGKGVDVRHIGRELGVRYALEGSVRRSDNEIRVNVQLIDTETGALVWADRFDGDLSKLMRLHDDITSRLARTLEVELTDAETRRAQRERPNNPDAVDLAMQGQALLNRPRTRENLTQARILFEQALQADPALPAALAGYSRSVSHLVTGRWVPDRPRDAKLADEAATRLLLRYPDNADGRLGKCDALRALKKHDAAIIECSTAIALNPSLAPAYSTLASSLIFAGKAEKAFEPLRAGLQISPRDPWANLFYALRAHAHEHLGQHEAAIEWGIKSIAMAPWWLPYIDVISAYGWTGQKEKGSALLVEFNKLMPNYSVQTWLTGDWSDDPIFLQQIQMIGEGLKRAGMPEK
jgi:adenylate cyclase